MLQHSELTSTDDWLIILPLLLSIALIGPSWRRTFLSLDRPFQTRINRLLDVKMWHVGIHIIDVDPNHIEPDMDEYYSVWLAPRTRVALADLV